MSTNLVYHWPNQPYDVKRILNEFAKSTFDNVFIQNKAALLNGASKIDFLQDRWLMYPLAFCNYYYGEQYLYPVILLANNLGSMFDFKPENLEGGKIIAPSYNNIVTILSNSLEQDVD